MDTDQDARLILRLPAELRDQIEAMATKEERSLAWMTRRLLVEAITARGKQNTDKETP